MTELKPFSETIDVQPFPDTKSEAFPGGKGMAPADRAVSIEPQADDASTVNEDKSFKEFWTEVERVAKKLGVGGNRVIMALSQQQKGVLEHTNVEDMEIVKEFSGSKMIEQCLVGGLIKREYGEGWCECEETECYGWITDKRLVRLIRSEFNIDEGQAKQLLKTAQKNPEKLSVQHLQKLAKLLGRKSKAAKYIKIRTERKAQVKKLFDKKLDPLLIKLRLRRKDKDWTQSEIKKFLIELGMDERDIEFAEHCGEYYHSSVGWY